MRTLSKILNKEFEFSYNHLGLFVTEDLHLCDKYIVIIEGQDFEYSRGIGYRVPVIDIDSVKLEFKKVFNKNPQRTKSNLLLYISELKKVSKPKPLDIDDILYSLILDSNFSSENFDDFCDDLGYNNDSMKANDTYRACQKNAKKLRTFIKDINQASELFQNY
jgi:hypothetical protein